MGMGNSFMDLVVWQYAVELSTEVYRQTAKYPKSELFGLVRACFINGFVKGHDFSRAENGRKIEGF